MGTIVVDAVRLPVTIERGARGGPAFRTTVTTLDGGYETTQINWAQARWTGTIGYGIGDRTSYYELIEFFRSRRGKARGFLFKDWSDYYMINQLIGVGDGVTTQFQLIKTYNDTIFPFTRKITRPLSGTVSITDGGSPVSPTINYTTGIVTFAVAPVASNEIRATCDFDIPMRFDTDYMQVELEWSEAGRIPNLPIVEIRE